MDSLTAGAGTAILVGNETSSGSLTVRELTLGGGVLTCDPDFSSGGTPSTAELSFASGVDGTLNAGRNSIVGLGSGSLAAAQKGQDRRELWRQRKSRSRHLFPADAHRYRRPQRRRIVYVLFRAGRVRRRSALCGRLSPHHRRLHGAGR